MIACESVSVPDGQLDGRAGQVARRDVEEDEGSIPLRVERPWNAACLALVLSTAVE